MSQSATPATQNDMTTCLETFEKERFCGFPHRHGGEATGKSETRDETRGSTKTSISCETSSNFHSLYSFKIDVFLRVFVGISKICNLKITMFRAKLPSIFSTCHKMPRLPRNLHHVATWCSHANAICKSTWHDTSKVLRLPRKMTMDTSKVLRLPRKLSRIFGKRRKKYCACLTKRLSTRYKTRLNVTKCHAYTTRNEATKRWKPPKMTPPAELTIGTAIRGSHERFCERLRTETRRRANTLSAPRPPEWTGTLATHSGKTYLNYDRMVIVCSVWHFHE